MVTLFYTKIHSEFFIFLGVALHYTIHPIKKENYKSWGAISGIKQEYKNRNKKIKNDYKQGISIENLAQKYYLSVDTIRKILYTK